MKPVIVGGVRIGEGMPKIIAPLVAAREDELVAEAARFRALPVDIAEWRADFFEGAESAARVVSAALAIREALGGMPLLFTFRTKAEGGEGAVGPAAYAALLEAVCAARAAELIDVEMLAGADAERILRAAKANGLATVGSSHDFSGTPSEEEMTARLIHMRRAGADIPKLAVMPRAPEDVLALLGATRRASAALDCPVITMSMGALGAASRVSGEAFGSACTFGSVSRASAPGQIPVRRLRSILEALSPSNGRGA